MKILFFDSRLPKGHFSINRKYLRIMSKFSNINLCADSSLADDINNIEVININWAQNSNKNSSYSNRINSLCNIIKVSRVINKTNPDIIYVASYDIITWFVSCPLLFKFRDRILIQEHDNIDQLHNRLKYRLFSLYKNLFRHLVFEEYIKDRLLELGVHENMVYVIPHPVPKIEGIIAEAKDNNLIIGLSNSNSEYLIEDIVRCQKENHILQKTGHKMILKSKNIKYNDSFLVCLNGWISSEDYKNWCSECNSFLIPFPKNGYSYRVSNVFMEAVSLKKHIIASRFPLAEFYSKKYPGLCSIYDNPDRIIELLNVNNYNFEVSRNKFLEDHSDEKIEQCFKEIFETIIKERESK